MRVFRELLLKLQQRSRPEEVAYRRRFDRVPIWFHPMPASGFGSRDSNPIFSILRASLYRPAGSLGYRRECRSFSRRRGTKSGNVRPGYRCGGRYLARRVIAPTAAMQPVPLHRSRSFPLPPIVAGCRTRLTLHAAAGHRTFWPGQRGLRKPAVSAKQSTWFDDYA